MFVLPDRVTAWLPRLIDRLKTAITELGYEAVLEDLLSADLIGGEESLLARHPRFRQVASRLVCAVKSSTYMDTNGFEPRHSLKAQREETNSLCSLDFRRAISDV